MNWVHGTYVIQPNNSMIMTPMGDGYQQIQDPCAAVTNFIENYNMTEFYQNYQIFLDPVDGYKLHLFQFDGSPLAPQFVVSTSPNMLPTVPLRNVTVPVTTSNGFSSTNRKRSAGEKRWSQANAGLIAVATVTTWISSIAGPLLS
jgi:Chaperone for protein-folding within the ER, fungal